MSIEISRNVVLGYLVLLCKRPDHSSFVAIQPIIALAPTFEEFDMPEIEQNEEVIGILQAPQGTYEVYGMEEDGDIPFLSLGFEYAGVKNLPNWEAVFKEEQERRRKRNANKERISPQR